jgi:pSer/pThr/pTyr-binding forkhead associated (FHA) protein
VLNLAKLVQLAKLVPQEEFLEKCPDPVFVAMGVLEAQEIRARCGATTEVKVSKPATHNPRRQHPLAGQVFVLPVSSKESGSIIFGRERPADILVPDDTVSILHCMIEWSEGRVTITDPGSTNGTQVNLLPLREKRPVALLNEDIVTIGPHSFQYFLPDGFYQVLCGMNRPSLR